MDPDLEPRLAALLKNKDNGSYALTCHAGNNRVESFVAYNVVHLYVAETSPMMEELESELKVRRVPVNGANLVVGQAYYRNSVFFGARQIDGLWVVSDLQLYLDLRRFPVRGREAADRILAQRLRPLWGESK